MADRDEDNQKDPEEEERNMVKIFNYVDTWLSKEDNKTTNKLLQEIKDSYLKFKQEEEDKINHGKPIENEVFKTEVNKALEKWLVNVIYIQPKKLRDEKLHKLHWWYFGKVETFASLDRISYRTDKNPDEEYKVYEQPSDAIIVKDEAYEMKEFAEHRTIINGLEPAKDRWKAFKTKKIKPAKKFKKDEKTMDDLRFNLERFHGRVGSANSSITAKTTFFATKTGQKWYTNSGVGAVDPGQHEPIRPIESSKELKNTYSYLRPEMQFERLTVEKNVLDNKHKELAEKRNEEEIKWYWSEFGKSKARFTEKNERKFNHNNIINVYEKTFKIDKSPDDIIKESEANIPEDDDDVINEEFDDAMLYLNQPNYPNNNSNWKNKIMYTRIENLGNYSSVTRVPTGKDVVDMSVPKAIPRLRSVNFNNDKNKLNYTRLREQNQQTGTYKPDMLCVADQFDKVLKTRIMSSKICGVKEIDTPKWGYTMHYVPWSAFDYVNAEKFQHPLPQARKVLTRPKTASEFASRHFKDFNENYLGWRQKMTDFVGQEIASMNQTLLTNNQHQGKINYGVEGWNSISNSKPIICPYLLPRSEINLLKKPPEVPGKKRRPKSKKKY